MNNLGPFGLLALAVGVAALFVLVGAIPVLVIRNLIARRPVATHLMEWFLYVLSAVPLIVALAGCYLYAQHKGIDEHTVHTWMNILTIAIIVFVFWRSRAK